MKKNVIVHGGKTCGKATAVCIGLAHCVDETQPSVQVVLTKTFQTPELNGCSRCHVQAVVLAASREAASLLHEKISALCEYVGARTWLLTGGTGGRADITAIRTGDAQILVGTVGRVWDLATRGVFDASKVAVLALPDVDSALANGFEEQVIDVLSQARRNEQGPAIWLTASDASSTLVSLVHTYVPSPAVVTHFAGSETQSSLPPGMLVYRVSVDAPELKVDALADLYETLTIQQAIVFCNTRRRVDALVKALQEREETVASLSPDMDPLEREHVLGEFRRGLVRVIATSDVAALGVDAVLGERVPFVVQFDLPGSPGTFLQRLWRFGADHSKSVALCFITDEEIAQATAFERAIRASMPEAPEDPAALLKW
jgi:translation initiation factor 4A